MTFVILFEDNPGPGADIRKAHMADHLAFLERHAAQITAAGPLKSAQGEAAGGLWLVEVGSADAADALVKADPFWPAGLRKSVRILEWQQVLADGRCLI